MTINELIAESHATAVDKGWWDKGDRPILEQLMLMVSELAEAGEEWRKPNVGINEVYYTDTKTGQTYPGQNLEGTLKPEGFSIEIADVLIRIADTCGRYKIDLDEALKAKLAYNRQRPYRHGGKRA